MHFEMFGSSPTLLLVVVFGHGLGVLITINLCLLDLPIVDINVVLNASSENRNNIQVLPTPESPINSNLKR